MNKKYFLGLDVGSVSVKVVLLDPNANIVWESYTRHKGRPVETTLNQLKNLTANYPLSKIEAIGGTGTGSKLIAEIIGVPYVNEVIAQAKATEKFSPKTNTIIEIGGQDSKLITLFHDSKTAKTSIEDFSMNNSCAAGTGSFLDQQASRLGVAIEDEFSRLALKSTNPPRLAGRCSVFAKSDMIHLQQIGTPDYDIMAGLCYAFARTFKSDIVRGKELAAPVSFQGGVAANEALVKAFRNVFELGEKDFTIPEHFYTMGAIGAALVILEDPSKREHGFRGLEALENYLATRAPVKSSLKTLEKTNQDRQEEIRGNIRVLTDNDKEVEAYIGVDVGSLSTNVIALDKDKKVIAWRYLKTAGRPLKAVCQGLKEIGEEVKGRLKVMGVGTTGSGRYLTSDYVGGDIVINEITAQATASINYCPEVDTVFEIGGQDSKYISIDNGVVVDFEMNKACAAGTGSFLEEQAEKLDLNIVKEFADNAFNSTAPGSFGDRCTVFIETDLVSHQQLGMPREDLVAGLAYSIVVNYINKVVQDRRIGDHILFQGGVASNEAVVSAFEKVTGKKIFVPPFHNVTGAIGVAMMACDHMRANKDKKTRFKGFDLSKREYNTKTFTCKGCANFCEIRQITFGDERPVYYGARCEKYEIDEEKKARGKALPDLFAEREKLLFRDYVEEEKKAAERGGKKRKRIGIPRVLNFYELFPYWSTFFEELGFEVVLSEPTNPSIIHESVESVVVDTCFPIKIVHGHIKSLIKKKVDYIFLPSVINMEQSNPKMELNYSCPLVQSVPYIIESAMDVESKGVKLLKTPVYFQRGEKGVTKALTKLGKELRKPSRSVKKAVKLAYEAQERFQQAILERGKEILDGIQPGTRAVVVISRPYNGCDSAMNLGLPRKLRDMGVLAIPIDFLPLHGIDISDEHPNMFWKYGQRIISAAEYVAHNADKLTAIYISNFKCGPDSFISHFMRKKMGKTPYLQLEIDEHSADAGVITRCEAFFDSLEGATKMKAAKPVKIRLVEPPKKISDRKVFIPYMADHAFPVAAAFRGIGIDAEVLPESDEVTLEYGRKHSSGKECFPFIVTTGDILKKIHEPGFDQSKSAFLMPSANGPCRFGQYHKMHQVILDEMGYDDVMLVSPNSKNSYSEFGDAGRKFKRMAWQVFVAMDIIQKLTWETRPYEVKKGETDKVYSESIRALEACMEKQGENFWKINQEIRDAYAAIKVDKSVRKPIIGIVGEIFVRTNKFSNDNIVRQIESLGGEAWVASMSEWLLYINHRFMEDSIWAKNYGRFAVGLIQDLVQRYDEHRLTKLYHHAFEGTILTLEEPTTLEVLRNSEPYMHSSFGGEAILSIGKAADYIKRGASGIVNVMPFTCLPGMVVSAISRRFREEHGNIPWLSVSYDGQRETNTFTRLEAFMHQAEQFKEKRELVEA